MIRCSECQPLLLDHHYGLLEPAEYQAVDAHLAQCSECRSAAEAAYKMKGLIAQAARSTHSDVSFTPPNKKAEPARAPASSRSAQARGRVVGWVVAASLFLTIVAFGAPALRDGVGYALHRPTVDRTYQTVREIQAQRDQLQAEITRKRNESQQRLNDALAKQQTIEAEWIAAEKAAVKKAAQRPFQVEIRGPGTAVAGAPNQYHISVKDSQGRPHPAEVAASLKDAQGKELYSTTFQPDKNPDGAKLQLPAGIWAKITAGSEVFLNVTAVDGKTGARSELLEPIHLYEPTYTTFLTTDKPIYQPGETVYFRSLTLDRTRFLPPSRDQVLRFEIKTPSGQVLAGSELQGLARLGEYDALGKFQPILGPDGQPVRGVASGAVPLAEELPGGEYVLNVFEIPNLNEVKALKPGPLATRKFIVNKYTPDRLQKKFEFDGKSYGPGDTVQALVEIKDQATPLAQAALSVTITVDDEPVVADAAPQTTDKDGKAALRFKLPNKPEIKQGRVDINVIAKGINETITEQIPLATRTLNVEFFPEGGDLLAGVENRVYFRVTNTLGKPADITGILTDGIKTLARVQTLTDADNPGVNQGLGVFTITPQAGKVYALQLEKPISVVPPVVTFRNTGAAALAGNAATVQRGYVLPTAKAAGIVLRTEQGVVPAHQPIPVQVTSADVRRVVLVGAYCRNQAIAHETVTLEPGKPATLALKPTNTQLGGVTRITVFEAPSEDAIGRADLKPLAERLIYRQPGELLKLNVTAINDRNQPSRSFTPGETVQLKVESRDENEQPKPALLWAAVVNESVLTMAKEKTARLLPTHFLLNGEVRKGDDLEHADFLLTNHPKAAESLDLLLGTQGWRRFAEQAPEEFRKKVPAEDADKLLVAAATDSPIPTGWRTEARKVFEEFWPKYEASLLERETAESAHWQLQSSGDLERDLQRANALYAEKLAEFGEAAADLEPFDATQQTRKQWLPVIAAVLLILATGFLVTRALLFPKGASGRRALAIGAVGMILLTVGICASTLLINHTNADWRELAKIAPKPQREDQVFAARAAAPGQKVVATGAVKPDQAVDAEQGFQGGGFAELPGRGIDPGAFPPAVMAPGDLEGAGGGDPRPKGLGVPAGPRGQFGGPAKQKVQRNDLLEDGHRGGMARKRPVQGPVMPAMPGGGMGGRGPAGPGDKIAMDMPAELRQLKPFGRPSYFQFLNRRSQELNAVIQDAKKDREELDVGQLHAAFSSNAPPQYPPMVIRQYAHTRGTTDPDAPRTDFTETLLWQPLLVVPQSGNLTLEFSLSDAINPYQVLIAGHTLDGRLGAQTSTLEVRKPFAIDPKLPQEISTSDKLDVAIQGQNATAGKLVPTITLKPEGFTNLGASETFDLPLERESGARKIVRLAPSVTSGSVSLTVTGKVAALEDRITRSLRVLPDGFPASAQVSDVLEQRLNAKLALPEQIIPGTLALKVTIYPNTLSEMQAGLDGLLREPYGCFEQTSTTNYPNVMILDYLNETDKATPEISSKAKGLLERGYAKLISFECQDPAQREIRKGYEWFGGSAPPHEALTAYGLMQFSDMARVAPVDQKMIERTREYLLSRRDGQGGFLRNSRALDSFGYAPNEITNAYIVWAITESERGLAEKSELKTELNALTKLASEGTFSKDSYFLALVANAFINRGQLTEGTALLKKLAAVQAQDGSVPGASTSITRSSGKDLLIETTSLALLGWLKVNETGTFRKEVEHAAKWMGTQRGGYGAFGGTQSTILALKALIDYARSQKRPAENGTVRVFLGTTELAKKDFTTEQTGPIVLSIDKPEEVFKNGAAELRVETDAKQAYPCTVAWECRTRKPNSSAECPVALSTKLTNNKLSEGDTTRLAVQVKNLKKAEHGMVVAIVGIPAGLKIPEDMKQLTALTAKPQNGREVVSYFEVKGRELVLYWRGMGPEQTVDLGIDLIADYTGEFRGPASRAYLYYGSEHKHWVDPIDVTVAPK